MITYSPEIVERICELVACGSNISKVCQSEGMPTKQAVYLWLVKYPEFKSKYESARLARLETIHDELRDKLENCPNDKGSIKKLELLIKMELWMMEKLNPQKYGQRAILSGDKENPLTVNLASVLDERIAARAARLAIEHSPPLSMPVIDAKCEVIDDKV